MSKKLEKYETIAIKRTGSCKIRKEKILKKLKKNRLWGHKRGRSLWGLVNEHRELHQKEKITWNERM